MNHFGELIKKRTPSKSHHYWTLDTFCHQFGSVHRFNTNTNVYEVLPAPTEDVLFQRSFPISIQFGILPFLQLVYFCITNYFLKQKKTLLAHTLTCLASNITQFNLVFVHFNNIKLSALKNFFTHSLLKRYS